ncbi:sphingosine-1-phosphate phosphatase 1-like [Brachionus plicatilis]|uniref:Sphingosine-1-phosphate phosphatase 1-like n=1 Tax=Brachionus plicatilis TaxID=10195 RepID=A0A3M7RL74_BRAPC|nr:sphingosine-1-phosphate phosphatase 1-like [Brachionus plicatilis]
MKKIEIVFFDIKVAMHDLINYLNSPHLVAAFQKIFGIEPTFESKPKILDQPVLKIKKRSPLKKNETPEDKNYVINQTSHKRTSSNPKKLVNITDHSHLIANTLIHNRFWYYFFHLGAAMGNEIFYCLFFPFWFWNVDGAIARKVAFLWGIFMYVGQATKDILCMPRPASPPVVKLEERYLAEYGFPSTHAMVSAGLPISVLVLSYSRYNIDLSISIAIVVLFCSWVSCSRLYLGMHSILDVVAGVLYSILVLLIMIPILEPIDHFILEYDFSPLVVFTIGYLLCHYYPSLRQWSTARGDTVIIIGSVIGFSIGSYLNNKLGFLQKPDEPPLYDIHFPNAFGYFLGVLRTIMGLVLVLCTRQLFKKFLLKFLCYVYKLDHLNPESKKQKKIELPYNYMTYFAIGVNIAFTFPYLFRLLSIERDYKLIVVSFIFLTSDVKT